MFSYTDLALKTSMDVKGSCLGIFFEKCREIRRNYSLLRTTIIAFFPDLSKSVLLYEI